MKTMWLPISLALAALVYTSVDIGVHYHQLPPRVASHFDLRGHPDGWTTKQEFVAITVAMFALMSLALAAIPLVAHFAPAALINLPNKEYWLAPEREVESRRAISRWSLYLIAATFWLLALIAHEAMAANLRQPPQLKVVWWLLGGFFAIVFLMSIQLIVRFRKPQHPH
jgi:serine/threonine-protein kinase